MISEADQSTDNVIGRTDQWHLKDITVKKSEDISYNKKIGDRESLKWTN